MCADAPRAPSADVPRTPSAEEQVLARQRDRELWAAVASLPGRCAELLTALAEDPDLSYAELADRLGLPRGSIGPTRSRCLARLRTVLHSHRD
ncbi:RNA polymerase sigma factor [Kitasatospora sp. NPDC004240]